MNSASYPKIFYPEVYILEGGYCGFFNSQPVSLASIARSHIILTCQKHCNPCGYTPMDDPKHFARRDTELHTFRNFGRTKSFTYGETAGGGPACPPLAFAAASAAVGRRANQSANTITEEEQDEQDSSHAGDSSFEVDASPSLRVASMPQAPIFGFAKPRTLGRMNFQRNASYAGFGAGPVR
jgi:M-phase inducer tyrosine phosphatase